MIVSLVPALLPLVCIAASATIERVELAGRKQQVIVAHR